ncbi:hypothetical protein [Flavobacterium sp. N3904]|uniref:hypothetical protein n=1 Tax=Flavobacterium sp. N3904 TaxID=2986835 RepID=UPI002224504F|nr:hypothetical protein [Flavobacterium sp. N3904]
MNKLNINKTILLLIVLINIVAYGQDNPISKVDLPNFTPPSPEAFQITKYGDVPVDEYNGKVNLNIPLFQYQAGQLKVPVSLNYYGSGIKVSDIATQTGINWTLDAGGVISREIRDLCDEQAWSSGTRLNLTDTDLLNLNKEDCSPEAGQLRSYIDQNYDTEVDIFKFHFLNYSGSFYLDDNFKAQMVKNEQHLKIEITETFYTDKTIVITDPYGVKYYFGGVTATESTQSRFISGSGNQLNTGGPTSFYLYKMEHPVNGTVLFEYGSQPVYEVPLSSSYSLSITTSNYQECTPNSQSSSQSSMRNTILDQKYLKKIYSLNNSDVLEFNRTFIDNINFKYFLNSIDFKKGNNLFSKIDLTYIGLESPTDTNRFFLDKISFNKDFIPAQSTGKKYEEYRMEYNNAELLPGRFSKNIDVLGYFNNVNNSTLVPCSALDMQNNPLACPNRKANFEYASKGVLKNIYYPTGGYTNFEYESQPTVVKKYDPISGSVYINSFTEDNSVTPQTKLHDEILQMAVLYDQDVTITLEANTENNVPNHYAAVTLKITNLTKNPNVTDTYQCSTGSKSILFKFLGNNLYKIEIDIAVPTATYSGYSATGGFSFDLHVGYDRVEGTGVRIKRIKDFATSGTIATSKSFYYTSYYQMQDLFADVFTARINISNSGGYKNCAMGLVSFQTFPYYTQTIHSNYIYSDYTYSNFRAKEYANVTVSYGGDHFENGGIEKTFLLSEESTFNQLVPVTPTAYSIPYTIPDAKDNVLSLDGLLLKERTFKNINGSVFKIQEKQTQYEHPLKSKKLNVFGFETYHNPIIIADVYKVIKIYPIDYNHNGYTDDLNPDENNRCCGGSVATYNARIKNYMTNEITNYLIANNDPIIADFNSKLGSGIYVIEYTFSSDFTTARIILKEKVYLCTGGNSLSNYFIGSYYTNSYLFNKKAEKEILYVDPVPANLISWNSDDAVEDPVGQEQLEATYKKVIANKDYEYGSLNGLPTKVTTTDSKKIENSTEYVYVNQANTLTGLTTLQQNAYSALLAQNSVATPIQTSQYKDKGASRELLATQRLLYEQSTTNPNQILQKNIQISKGGQNLETRVDFTEYDTKGNPSIVSYTNGSKTKYFYNDYNQIIVKIENYIGALNVFANPIGSTNPCDFINQYPTSFVTIFNYDAITNQISSIIDSKCKKTTYVYDKLHHLESIKDDDNTILQHFEYNYQTQN